MLAVAVMEVMAEKATTMPVVLATLMTAVLCFPCGCESWLFFFFNQLRLGASYLSPLYLGFHTVDWECLPGKSASSTVNLRTSGGRREV